LKILRLIKVILTSDRNTFSRKQGVGYLEHGIYEQTKTITIPHYTGRHVSDWVQ
jgi:hypothetical protein